MRNPKSIGKWTGKKKKSRKRRELEFVQAGHYEKKRNAGKRKKTKNPRLFGVKNKIHGRESL